MNLRGAARHLGIALSAGASGRLLDLSERMFAAGSRLNLLGPAERERVEERHLLDSITGLRVIDRLPRGFPLIDIGTGAGLPGLALACARPHGRFLLVDATRKKTLFVRRTAAAMGLDGCVDVRWSRAETLARERRCRERFQVGVARALAPLAVTAELVLPLLAVGGFMIAYRSGAGLREAAEVLDALRRLGGELWGADRFAVPQQEAARTLLVVRKRVATPEHYPRRPGVPQKRPLA